LAFLILRSWAYALAGSRFTPRDPSTAVVPDSFRKPRLETSIFPSFKLIRIAVSCCPFRLAGREQRVVGLCELFSAHFLTTIMSRAENNFQIKKEHSALIGH
jgi:hypothetical protein